MKLCNLVYKSIIISAMSTMTFSCALQKATNHKTYELNAKSDSLINGVVHVYEFEDKVKLNIRANNVKRNHEFAAHIHENADCSSFNAKSAGGHFSPNNNRHGHPKHALKSSHLGDLGNIKSDFRGIINTDVTLKKVNLKPDSKLSIMNRSLIIHAESDDYKSQPAGNSGKRIACVEII